ncbi:glycine cleavage system aminomethyltransferase GcvT [Corynebacterium sp. TAE3-ERU12]|uniref:glycine cleavage system aminomethyltransferase GcvT n=1 Tax=Corynebacterium sp. TAE3-ERU12 TaxID=2849491 RepID=UPI001C43F120|nr:glycine cleavage system aminomethyltransferase GcvT [Corynebacterium sp. TAE3-ERU12]MBV7295566.1 glycine cleavage system aminomethyltransferase GcvT [Corynebacterium sp. TAE3-ERU12]
MTDTGSEIRHSALYNEHVAMDAHLATVGGWEVPMHYSSPEEEHRAVRETVGVFDLSQMGEIRVSGPDAPSFLAHSLISAMKPIALGKAKYTMMVQEDGGIIDDLIAYRLAAESYLLVQNARNCDDVLATLEERVGGYDVELVNLSQDVVLLAVQGPKAEKLMQRLTSEDAKETVSSLRYYSCTHLDVCEVSTLVSRTGYTGEDGFELFVPAEEATKVWQTILEEGKDLGIRPCGLSCRDTLRIEAGMPLYGQELSREHNPLEAGFAALISPTKGRFIGRNALINQPEPRRLLVGLTFEGDTAPAEGDVLTDDEGNEVGYITSAIVSPTLEQPIAMAYLDKWMSTTGTKVTVGDKVGTVSPMPFYSRKKR